MIKITEKAINVQKIIDTASCLSGGAMSLYIGKVQSEINGKKVRWLEYETEESEAISNIRGIIEDATQQYDIKGYALVHRIGTLKPGEASIGVAISTNHSDTSLQACQYILNELKTRWPIWQKEFFEDGSEWMSPRPEKIKTGFTNL